MTLFLETDALESASEQAPISSSQLTFAHLLQSACLDPHKVKLHRHTSKNTKETPYFVWYGDKVSGENEFQHFQSLQSKPDKMNREYIASFVVTPSDETLFVGIYKNLGSLGLAPEGTTCPVNAKLGMGTELYQLEKTSFLSELEGRLVIYWDLAATRNWGHRGEGDSPKYVLEIKKDASEQVFPGFHNFVWSINQLHKMPFSWREKLSGMQGVYLLVCQDEGRQYVGSASGDEGFYSRWESYFKTGDGGNLGMRKHKTSGYQVSILEVASSSDTPDDILKKESSWKNKLMTKFFNGLNEN